MAMDKINYCRRVQYHCSHLLLIKWLDSCFIVMLCWFVNTIDKKHIRAQLRTAQQSLVTGRSGEGCWRCCTFRLGQGGGHRLLLAAGISLLLCCSLILPCSTVTTEGAARKSSTQEALHALLILRTVSETSASRFFGGVFVSKAFQPHRSQRESSM